MGIIQLNIGDHTSRVRHFIPFPKEYRADAQWARSQAFVIARTKASANVYFRSLKGKRSLSALLADRSIWVNYMLSPNMGESVEDWREIGLGDKAFRTRKDALATLIHELAHVNGAAGKNGEAESAVYYCGLGTDFEFRYRVDDPRTAYDPSKEE